MSRTQLALAGLVIFAVGGMLGAAVVHQPVPVATVSHAKQDAKLDEIKRTEDKALESVKVATVLPPEKVIKWRKVYIPAPNGGCALAEESGSTTDTGSGSIVISSDRAQGSKTESQTKAESHASLKVHVTPTPRPRWSVGLGASTQLTETSRVGLAASLGVRLVGDTGLRLSADLPVADLKAPRVSLMLEWAP